MTYPEQLEEAQKDKEPTIPAMFLVALERRIPGDCTESGRSITIVLRLPVAKCAELPMQSSVCVKISHV
jgi:hypothetical protein